MCALAMMVSACSTTSPRGYLPTQQNLLQKCPESLPTLVDGTGKTVMVTMKEWATQYHDCATRHNGLVDAVTKEATQ